MSAIAAGCPSLTVVSLKCYCITVVGLGALAGGCSDMEDVNLAYCSFTSDCGLRALSQQCRNLCAINISLCRDVRGTGLTSCSPTLAHMNAESCKIDMERIMAIVSGGEIEFLDFSWVSWCLPTKKLAVTGAGFAGRLKDPELRGCGFIGDEPILEIANCCPFLEE
ncbi:hypothetical protein NL676_022076 [Syzygium grande]|nr:hypothetical protein NL676_022076 [Syzygium grande]